MKLIIYKISTIIALFLSLFVSLTFLVISIIRCITVKNEVFDKVMYIICFTLLVTFIIMEIINSFSSIKKGSQFARNLAYDEPTNVNRNLLIIMGGGAIISFLVLIYSILLCSGLQIPLKNLAFEVKSLILSFSITALINTCVVLLFPIFGKDDISMKE